MRPAYSSNVPLISFGILKDAMKKSVNNIDQIREAVFGDILAVQIVIISMLILVVASIVLAYAYIVKLLIQDQEFEGIGEFGMNVDQNVNIAMDASDQPQRSVSISSVSLSMWDDEEAFGEGIAVDEKSGFLITTV